MHVLCKCCEVQHFAHPFEVPVCGVIWPIFRAASLLSGKGIHNIWAIYYNKSST